MSPELEDETLNTLLAQPSQVSDRGFCQNTLKLIGESTAYKTKIFSSAGLAWLILVLALVSPVELTQQIQKFGGIFISFLSKPLNLAELAQSSFPSSGMDFSVPTFALLFGIILVWLINLSRT